MNKTDRRTPFEIELKLHAGPLDLAKLREQIARLVPGAAPPVTRHLVTAYYDTPDLALAGRGLALRLRRAGSRYSQSVKARHVPGAIKRPEWEWPIDGNALDLHHLEHEEFRSLIPPHLLAKLRPIFTADVQRTIFRIRSDDGSEIELALDDGALRASGAASPICEVELELMSTPDEARGSAQLYQIALNLHRAVPLMIATQSKADIGYALVAGRLMPAVRATRIVMTPETTVGDGMSMILRTCIGQILGNQAAVLAGDVEGVHQMRVGLRRLRAGFGLFRRFIGASDARWFKDELKWLAGELGRARDWDVLTLETLAMARDEAVPGIDSVIAAARSAQHEASEGLAAAIRSPRYTNLILTLGVWVETAGWSAGLDQVAQATLGEKLSRSGGQLLARRVRRAAKAGSNVSDLDEGQRHQLRVALKRLRYGADFMEALYPVELAEPYLHALSELQDVLGTLNDLAVGRRLLTELDRTVGTRGGADMTELLALLDRRLGKSLDRLPKAWHRFGKVKPFWA